MTLHRTFLTAFVAVLGALLALGLVLGARNWQEDRSAKARCDRPAEAQVGLDKVLGPNTACR